MMIMRSKFFYCLLLFDFAFYALSHCIVIVRAYGDNDVVKKEAVTAPEEYLSTMAKNAEAVGSQVEEYFKMVNNNLIWLLALSKQTANGINVARKRLLPDLPRRSKTAHDMLDNVEQIVSKAEHDLDELKQLNDEMVENENPKINEKMRELVEKSERLKRIIKDAKGNVDGEYGTGAEIAEEINEKAEEYKTLWETIHENINKQLTVLGDVILLLNNANKAKMKTIFFFRKHVNFNKAKEAMRIRVHKNITASLNKTEEMKKVSETAQKNARLGMDLCEIMEQKAEKLTAELIKKLNFGSNSESQTETKAAASSSHLPTNSHDEKSAEISFPQPHQSISTSFKGSETADQTAERDFTESSKQLETEDEIEKINRKFGTAAKRRKAIKTKHNLGFTNNERSAYGAERKKYRGEGGTGAFKRRMLESRLQKLFAEKKTEQTLSARGSGNSDVSGNVRSFGKKNYRATKRTAPNDSPAADNTSLRGRTNAGNYNNTLKGRLKRKSGDGAVRSCVSLLALLPSLCLWCFLTALHCCQAVAA